MIDIPDKQTAVFSEEDTFEEDSACLNLFKWLIDPLPVDDFIKEIWECKPYVVNRNMPGYYECILSKDNFSALLEFGRFSANDIRVVRAGKQIAPAEYVRANGRIKNSSLSKYYIDGHSIVIHSLENMVPSIGKLVKGLQQFYSARVLINAYLTPGSAQALKAHFDSHDVLIMQISGSKNWRLYHEAARWPLNGSVQPSFTPDELPGPKHYTLNEGDWMYIPRGWVHDAESTEASSLHLTIGIHPIQWIDFLSKALTVASLNVDSLRRALPPGFLRNENGNLEIAEQMAGLLNEIKIQATPETIFPLLRHELIQQEQSLETGDLFSQLERLNDIGLASRMSKRPYVSAQIILSTHNIGIEINGTIIEAAEHFMPAFHFLCRNEFPFYVWELPGLEDEEKLTLVKQLITEGFVAWYI